MKNLTICTDCEYRTTDGCGPGPVMVCGHPIFKNAHNYEDAIIQWISINHSREACSYECPIIFDKINNGITFDEANLCRQWFDAVQDLNPQFLKTEDFKLAKKMYEGLNMPVPKSITSKII